MERRVFLGWATIMVISLLAYENVVEIAFTVGSWFGAVELVTTGWELLQSTTVTTPPSYADILLLSIIFTIAFKTIPEIPQLTHKLFYHIGTVSFYTMLAIAAIEVGVIELFNKTKQIFTNKLSETKHEQPQ